MPDTLAEQEPAYRCTNCPRLLHHSELGRYACRVCEDTAAKQIRAFATVDKTHPGLYDQLADVLVPGAAPAGGGKVTTSKSPPLPAAEQPLSLRGPGGIVSVLVGIEIRWLEENRFTIPGRRGNYENELGECVKVLINNLPWACDAFDDVATDLGKIAKLHGQATAAVTGERDVRVPLGCCPTVIDTMTGELCGAKIRVSPWSPTIRCDLCKTQWGHGPDWLRLGATMRGLPMPVSAVA